MKRTIYLAGTCLIAGLSVSSATAQEFNIKIVPAKGAVLEYAIATSSEMKTDRKNTINGEERAGRGGNTGPIKTAQNVVFREGPAGSKWRHYVTAEGSVTRDRNGEDQTTKIVGALAGKRIFVVKEDGKTVIKADSATGETIPRRTMNGIVTNLNLRGLVPAQAIEVKGKFELKKNFAVALRGLLQPVRAATAARTAGGRNRGQGGQGGRQRGRGRGRGRGGNTFNDIAVKILASKKVTTTGTGELVSVEEKDGQQFATIAIQAVLSGEGTPAELGLGNTRRRGRGGQAGQNAPKGKASLTMKVSGTVVVNQSENRVATVNLKGSVQYSTETSRTTNRNGEERKIETVSVTAGTFVLTATCANKGAPQEPKKSAGK